MSEEALLVGRIRNGTVLDHIEAGRALMVLSALNIRGNEGDVVSVGMNVLSKKLGKKDIVKVENLFLKASETNRLALIAPRATVNIIRDYKIVEKRFVQLPKSFVGVFKCPNPTCITNRREPIATEIYVLEKQPPLLQCKYCARILQPEELTAEI